MNKEIFVMEKKDFPSFIEELRKEYEFIGPVRKGKSYIFDKISDEKEISLDYDTTILPPKKLFFLPEEKLFSFLRKEKGRVDIKEEEKEAKRALFGVHPCDVKALLLLDQVMKGDFLDPYYVKRRQKTILIAMNCTQPRENCFCTSFDTGPELKEGYDLLLTDLDRKYLVEVGTLDGKRLLERVKTSKAGKGDVKKKKQKIEGAREKIKKKIETEGLEADLKKNFNHEKWKEVKDKCLFCGSCTHVCPTCFCYNVSDFNAHTLKSGERIRNWDSCLTLEFAEVALGGNFRKDREARIKQRIYHKLAYFKEQFGSFGCVGCGRCIDTCVKDIDITEVINEIRGG
jgi:ferredoxin